MRRTTAVLLIAVFVAFLGSALAPAAATITGNHFARCTTAGRPTVWASNVWDDNGAAVPEP